MARIMVLMSGGVDSSVAAALVSEAGHDVTGVTLKLWGGETDSGCCSAADVEDARRVAAQIGIPHYVFNFTDDFTRHVVEPYVTSYGGAILPIRAWSATGRSSGAALLIVPGNSVLMPWQPGIMLGSMKPKRVRSCSGGARMLPRTSRMCWQCSPAPSSGTRGFR